MLLEQTRSLVGTGTGSSTEEEETGMQPSTPNDEPQDNATWLFEYPDRKLHHAESWWSALFSMLLINLSTSNKISEIPLSRCKSSGDSFIRDGSLNCKALEFGDVLTDPKLNRQVFGLSEWNNKLLNLRPDILILRREAKRVTLIENKTIRSSLGKKLRLYDDAASFLNNTGWSAELLLLISVGYERNSEWKLIESQGVRLILWEHVLEIIDQVPEFHGMFSQPLKKYYGILRRRSIYRARGEDVISTNPSEFHS